MANATDVIFNLADPQFGIYQTTNRTVIVQAESGVSENGQNVLLPFRLTFTTDTNGICVASNLFGSAISGWYHVTVPAPPQRADFDIWVQSTNLGTLQASIIIGTFGASTYPAQAFAWSAAVSDARYAGGTNQLAGYVQFGQLLSTSNAIVSQFPNITNGQTTIVYSNPSAFTTPTQSTNIAGVVYSNNLLGYLTSAATNALANTNLLSSYATTNFVNTSSVNVSNGALQNLIATNALLIIYNSNLNAQVASSLNNASNLLQLTKQPVSAWLTNLSITGAVTNKLAAGLNFQITSNFSGDTIILNATNQTFLTNGITAAAFTPLTSFLLTNTLPVLTNGLVGNWITNGFATTNYVNNITNGLVGQSVTNGLATQVYAQSLTNGLASTNYVNVSTNGFVGSGVTNGLATQQYVQQATNSLATTNFVSNYVNGATNPLATISFAESLTNNLATTNYVNSQARLLINLTNAQTLDAITNAIANQQFYSYYVTNQLIVMNGFGSANVNTLFFIVNQNTYRSSTSVNYYYDGTNWNLYIPSSGILYQLGGTSPVGNTFTVVNGTPSGGIAYFTNWPLSSTEINMMTNVAQNIQVGGIVSGANTNQSLSANGTNVIKSLAGNGTTNFILNGVVGNFTTNNVFTAAGTNAISSIAASFVTNGASATNVYIASGNANIVVTTNSASSWTLTVPNQTGTTYRFYNTNLTVGLIVTNGTSVGIGTNTSLISGGSNSFPQQVFFVTNNPFGNLTTATSAIAFATNQPGGLLWVNRDGNSNDWLNIITNN